MNMPDRFSEIIDKVCAKHLLPRADVMGQRRTKALTACRDEIWWRLYQMDLSGGSRVRTHHLGEWFNRDRSAVHSGIHRFEKTIIAYGEQLQAEYEAQRRARKAELISTGDITA